MIRRILLEGHGLRRGFGGRCGDGLRRFVFMGVPACCLLSITACQVTPNMFTDELSGRGAISTPSVERVRASGGEPVIRHQFYEPVSLAPIDGTVTHLPLFFETNAEDWGDEKDAFAWTGCDYIEVLVGRGRFLVALAVFPLSALDTPPWQIMESDGHPDRKSLTGLHDAAALKTSAPCKYDSHTKQADEG